MYRKKNRENRKIRFGIRIQMTAGLFAVLLVSGIFLYWLTDSQLEKSREDQIIRDLQTVRENTEIYVRQLLILNEANNDEESFNSLAETIVQEMYGSSGRYELEAYSRDGKLLAYNYRENHGNDQSGQDAELLEAVNGNSAFTLMYSEEGRLEVWFAMPKCRSYPLLYRLYGTLAAGRRDEGDYYPGCRRHICRCVFSDFPSSESNHQACSASD